MLDPRKYHSMTCPTCEREVAVHEDWDRVICPTCKIPHEVSWDGSPDGGSGLVAIDSDGPPA